MKINQVLVEATQASVAFAFGRFNPAHRGHIEVWRAVEEAGKNWFIGTNPSTIGPNDPLTFEQKSAWMEEIYPPITGHIVPQTTVLSLAAYIFKKLRNNESATIAYVTDDTDWAWSGKLLNQYNGVEGAHGYYKFAQITHVPSPRVSSATALRDAARADDKVAFYHASGTDPKLKVNGLSYFDTVKQACEKYPLPVKRAKKVKEGQIDEATNWKGAAIGGLAGAGLGALAGGPVGAAIGGWAGASMGSGYRTWDDADVETMKSRDQFHKTQKDHHGAKKWHSFAMKAIQSVSELHDQAMAAAEDDWYDDEDEQERELDNDSFIKFYAGYNDIEADQNITYLTKIEKLKQLYNNFLKDFLKTQSDQHIELFKIKEEEQKTIPKTWDQMTAQEKISGVKGRTVWNEKTKKYYTVFDVPAKQTTDEASLSTMRDYFAGDEEARDPYEITKQRLHFSKDKDKKPTVDKRFRSQEEYEQWLIQNHLKHITPIKEDENINVSFDEAFNIISK